MLITTAQTVSLLKRFDRVLILTHVRPDGDTVGSAAALCAALRARGKTAYVLSNEELTRNTAPYLEPYIAPEDFIPEKVIAVDVASETMLTRNAQSYVGKVDLAIDHHPSFERFGKANLVKPDAAACGEALYDVLAGLGPITPVIALPLYMAIATDCGCFSYGNTSAYTHAVAAALIRTGIDYRAVNQIFFQTKTKVRLQLEAAMLENAEFLDQDRIAILTLPLSLEERLHVTSTDSENISSLGRQIEGVDCAVTMHELEPDVWRISLRTGARVNACKTCMLLEGGGHVAAAGCTIHASFNEARHQILAAIRKTALDCTLPEDYTLTGEETGSDTAFSTEDALDKNHTLTGEETGSDTAFSAEDALDKNHALTGEKTGSNMFSAKDTKDHSRKRSAAADKKDVWPTEF